MTEQPQDAEVVCEDALGRRVRVPRTPARIVSLVPSQTELLAALGLDAEVVGITRYCVHPDDWRARKAIVGGTKKARFARVEALRPDLILANREENTREDVETLERLAPVYVTQVRDVPDGVAMVRAVGTLVGRAEAAEALASQIEAAFEALAPGPPVRVAYMIWRKPWMTVGSDTYIHDMLKRGGLENVFGDQTRYPETSLEAIQALGAAHVLLSSEPYPFGADDIAEVSEALGPGVGVRLVNGEVLSWYGSRMLEAPAYLRALGGALRGDQGLVLDPSEGDG